MSSAPKPHASRRWPKFWLAGASLLGLAAAVVLAITVATAQAQRKTKPPAAQAVTELTQRCQVEMLRGTCGAMQASPATPSASRVFIAGVGEVDGAKFAALRRAGDAMCGEVETACRTDWQGGTCKIARALYPLPAATAASAPTGR
jgi:hypothetical protein